MNKLAIKSWLGIGLALSYALTDMNSPSAAQSLLAPIACAGFMIAIAIAISARVKGNAPAPMSSEINSFDGSDY